MKARASDNVSPPNGTSAAAAASASTTTTAATAETHDLSILRKPIQTTVTGFHEAMKAYQDGTDEIRKLLAIECDIIYECKACRNIFRSLANFISHKRIYCKTNFNSANHFHFRHGGCIDQDISTIIQIDQDCTKHRNQDKDLGSIIDRLVRREQNNRLMKLNDFYDQAKNNLTEDEILEKKHVLQLDKVTNSSIAVFQTLKNECTDNIKIEVNEVHHLMQKEKTVLGPDGKVLCNPAIRLMAAENSINSEHQCKICPDKFATEKTLKLHIKAKHISSTYVYPCPSCTQTFMQPLAVIRHLSNDHKKSMRRIRLMRDSIFRRRTRINEIPIKGPSRELARLQMEKDRVEQQQKIWQDSNENAEASTCKYCGKSFERRAALIAHTKSCVMKTKSDERRQNSDDLLNRDGSNELSNSLDNFLRMLNKEKQIQASVENSMAEEAILKRLEPEAIHNENGTTEPKVFVKNKRKQNRTRKTVSKLLVDEDDAKDLFWNMDDDGGGGGGGGLTIVKAESLNENSLLNVSNSTDVTPIKSDDAKVSGKLTPEKTTDCTICAKKFANISNLRRHVAMYHYRQKKYGCKLCDNKAFRKFDIINHLLSNHSISNENDEALPYVDLIEIDKNKFNEEKALAVAEALLKLQEKERVENGSDESVQDELVVLNVKEDLLLPDTSNENSNIGYEDSTTPPNSDSVKKRGRPRLDKNKSKSLAAVNGNGNGNDTDFVIKTKITKLSRNSSSNSLPDDHYAAKRPVRNRIKAVNKDFVYDLSNLLKKDTDHIVPIPVKTHKRKSSSSNIVENGKDDLTLNAIIATPVKRATTAFSDIKGAANVMAKRAVQSNRACFNKPPEIPLERPIVPSKIIQYRRSENSIQAFRQLQQEHAIASDITAMAHHQNRISDRIDYVSHVKRRRLSKKISHSFDAESLAENNFTTKEVLPKNLPENHADNNKILVKCPTEEEFNQYLKANRIVETTPKNSENIVIHKRDDAPSIPIGTAPQSPSPTTALAPSTVPHGLVPTAPPQSPNPKRITLMQRIAENKNKRLQESLLKINLYGNSN